MKRFMGIARAEDDRSIRQSCLEASTQEPWYFHPSISLPHARPRHVALKRVGALSSAYDNK